ncbi:MAG: hypothetical protein E7162_06415 [Firmicutes bacterium]|nr:hypothetical protein [Bacillota bacterium]
MGIVLGIYAGTTIAGFLMEAIASKAMDERLEREGYTYTDKVEKGTAEKIQETLQVGLIMLIPVINFIFGCIVFFGTNSFYKSMLEDGLSDGSIRRKTEEEKEEQKIKKELKKTKTKIKEVTKEVVINKPYSEMTNEEKLAVLEREKSFLLSINNREETKAYNDKGAYKKN